MSSSGVTLTDLHKSFGTVKAVDGISLDIPRGQAIALLGPNGAGKSTTIDMMLGLLTPNAGSVDLFGHSARDAVSRGLVGGMLQTGALLSGLSLRELITMVAGLYPAPRPVDEVLSLTELEDIADRTTTKLSGGQTQRVRLALALVGDPALLVLDEPTAALDVEVRREFWTAIRGVTARGTTVLFATHYLEEADQNADRIVLVARGRVVADGSPTQIKSRVGARTIRTTLPDVGDDALAGLEGVSRAERHGDSVTLYAPDATSADRALRALIATYPTASDFEVRGAGLEEAFLDLTGGEADLS